MRSRYLYRKLASFDIPTRDNIHRYECNNSIILSHCFLECFCLLELMSVNSKSHVGTLPPFYETLTQNEDVMTSNTYLKNITTQVSRHKGWFDFNHFSWAGSNQNSLTVIRWSSQKEFINRSYIIFSKSYLYSGLV